MNRGLRWLGAGLVVGLVAGFTAALMRRHPVSDYRTALAEELAARG